MNEVKAANTAKAERIAARVEAMPARSAWSKGVKSYALDLLDWYAFEANENPLTLETMLNGADNWSRYAWGGYSVALCYNAAIAERLCTASELKRNHHGANVPNSREQWPDVEARALAQAWQLIRANINA